MARLERDFEEEVTYEKCGFTREGVSRKWCFMFGRYYDLVHMSILEDEFRAQE